VLTDIDPVTVVVCADALEIINRPSKQVNAPVDFAKTNCAFLLKRKIITTKDRSINKTWKLYYFSKIRARI
jgi:hypothetical protein